MFWSIADTQIPVFLVRNGTDILNYTNSFLFVLYVWQV